MVAECWAEEIGAGNIRKTRDCAVGIIGLIFENVNSTGFLACVLVSDVGDISKLIGAFVTSVIAMLTLVVATTLLIGADWGPPEGVIALVLAAIITSKNCL